MESFPEPYLDITIPAERFHARTSGNHVMSIHAHAPYKLRSGDWDSRGQEFADTVIGHLNKFAPGIKIWFSPARLSRH